MIANKKELDTWIFEHANILGHTCQSIKSDDVNKNGLKYNVAFIDTTTQEKFEIIHTEEYLT